MRRAITLLLCTGGLLVTGCSGEDLPWQAHAAEDVRELDLLADVPVIEMTQEEFAARAAQRAAQLDDQTLREYAHTYGRLGFFDIELDLRPIIAGSSSDWVGATYSPWAKQVTLVGDASDHTIVHEFVHALQDQHFDLAGYDARSSTDAYLARRAAVEGDAVLAHTRFQVEQDGRTFDDVDWPTFFDSWREFSAELLDESRYPAIFLDYPSFVYTYGLEYCAANLTGVARADGYRPGAHDWELENQLFVTRPPATTQQVLNLDVDGAVGDPVVDVGLTTAPAALSDRVFGFDWDTLGEWYVYLLLTPLERDGAIVDARSLAAAWDGDRALFTVDLLTDDIASVWVSIWDDDAAAAAIVAAMWTLYGAEPPVDGTEADHGGTAADGEAVWIEQRGRVVVAAKNLSEDIRQLMVDAAFAPVANVTPRKRLSLPAAIDKLRQNLDLDNHPDRRWLDRAPAPTFRF